MILLVAITVALAALAVLAAIVVVAVGGGGELSTEHPDHPPLALPARRPVAGTDAALLRLPLGLWGYHKQITDEALERFTYELTERDTRIAVLEQELADVRQRQGGPARDARPALPPGDRSFAADDPLATRAGRAFGTPAEGGDPLATRTDRPTPATREDTLPTPSPPAAPPERAGSEPKPELGDAGDPEGVEDPRPVRKDGAE